MDVASIVLLSFFAAAALPVWIIFAIELIRAARNGESWTSIFEPSNNNNLDDY